MKEISILKVDIMKKINRDGLLGRLVSLRGTPDIKIITGIRRSGKSEIMRSFLDIVRKSGAASNIVYVDLTDLDNEALKDYRDLHSFVRQRYIPGVENILCIDEVQLCQGFELAVNSLHSRAEWDIYLTGSNAFLLSADLATLFTGRYVELHVLPFSFFEYRKYFGQKDVDEQLDEYLRTGGMSGSYPYTDDRDRTAYVKSVYDTIIGRDLVQKHAIANVTAFSALAEFMMDNVGNLENANGISKSLKEEGKPSSHVTVGNHMGYLCDAFLFYKVKRYDIRGKKYLETSDKYYLADIGFRWAVLGTRNMDYGRMYENLVAIELIRRGWTIYVGKLYQKEIDFVAMRKSEKVYIQVSDDISAPETFGRETNPLLAIRDAYPKILIARTRHETYDYQGIEIRDLARWLASEE